MIFRIVIAERYQ